MMRLNRNMSTAKKLLIITILVVGCCILAWWSSPDTLEQMQAAVDAKTYAELHPTPTPPTRIQVEVTVKNP
jgi:hypothetical protein